MLQTEIFSKPLFFFLNYFIFHSCPAGFYQGRKGMASCLPCIPGSYSDTDKAIICKDCDIGQYRPSQIEVNGVMTDTELTKCKYTKIGLN